mmetsp:Transcript_7029/g.24499  ORF Transcript_7029/g.24499 Transcript_7029/m.24499 type:complete len:225 (-) Transcript_7029:37-711(-)
MIYVRPMPACIVERQPPPDLARHLILSSQQLPQLLKQGIQLRCAPLPHDVGAEENVHELLEFPLEEANVLHHIQWDFFLPDKRRTSPPRRLVPLDRLYVIVCPCSRCCWSICRLPDLGCFHTRLRLPPEQGAEHSCFRLAVRCRGYHMFCMLWSCSTLVPGHYLAMQCALKHIVLQGLTWSPTRYHLHARSLVEDEDLNEQGTFIDPVQRSTCTCLHCFQTSPP